MFDGRPTARQIQIACSEARAGRARWPLPLLEENGLELGSSTELGGIVNCIGNKVLLCEIVL